MAEVFLKGSAYSIPFLIKSGKTTITNENVASVRLGLGNLTASWPGGRLRYSGGYWLFPVTQAQSYALPQGETYYQAQIQMASGETFSSKRQCIFVDGTIFRTPFGETQLTTPETADAQPIPAQIEPKPEQIAVEIQTLGGGLPSSYVLPPATSDKLGGVKADPATEQDTVPVRIGKDEKLYPNTHAELRYSPEKGVYWEYIPYTPRELRERAYETEKVITFENELMTVDEANKRWQEYQAENSIKSSELTALIAAAKAAVRERYPDEVATDTGTAEYAENSENAAESADAEATEKAE